MPTDDTEQREPAPRRLLRRTRNGGFSGGSMARTESLRMSGEDQPENEIGDEVDDTVDPEAMQRELFRQTRANEAAAATPDPAERMFQVAQSGDPGYAIEYRLIMLHRLLMRRVPLDQIAQQMRVSVSTVQKDRARLKEFLRKKAHQLNINEMIGDQLEKYDEISGMAMRVAGAAQGEGAQPTAMRLAAMRTALAAEADRTRFLNSAGVFDAMTFRRGEDGSEISDVQRLMEQTTGLIEQLQAGDSGVTLDDAPPQKVRRSRKGEGFGKFDMNDKDASSGDEETIEL